VDAGLRRHVGDWRAESQSFGRLVLDKSYFHNQEIFIMTDGP
jgi:hypothetical protein